MNPYYVLGLTVTGIISGLFAGLVGSGAEILVVPMLTLFNVLGSLKSRIGTSLIMLLPPIGIFAAHRFYKAGYVDVFAGLYMALLFTLWTRLVSQSHAEVLVDSAGVVELSEPVKEYLLGRKDVTPSSNLLR